MFKATNNNNHARMVQDNCVKLSHIPKISQLCRHLDNSCVDIWSGEQANNIIRT
jgi:hypothetical protein